MKPFITLLKVNFLSALLNTAGMSRRRGRNGNRKAVSGVGALLILCGVILYLSGTYSFGMATAFAPLGGLDVMLALMMIVSCAFPFIFTLYGAQGMVYSTKDVDLVLSLPVSSFTVMLSRVLALYLQGLLMVEMFLIPVGVAWLMNGGGGGAAFMVLLVVAGIFVALVPTLASLVFGTIISVLISRIRRFKNFFNIIFSLLLVGLLMMLSISFSSMMASGSIDIPSMRASFVIPPISWAVNAVQGALVPLILFIGGTLAPFLLLVWLFSLFYKPLLTSLTSTHLRTDYKLRGVKTSGQFGALFKKELGKFFGTPVFLLNSGMSILMLLAASVAAVIFKGVITDFLAASGLMTTPYLPLILLGVSLFFGSMVFVSCVSISLEGKTLWILREAPIAVGRIFTAKAGVNFVVSAVPILLCVPMLGYAFSIGWLTVALMMIVGLLFAFFNSVLGLLVNLFLPRMDAENDALVVKQSASVMVTMLLQFALVAIIVVPFFLLPSVSFFLYAAAACLLLGLLSALVIAMLNGTGRRRFEEL